MEKDITKFRQIVINDVSGEIIIDSIIKHFTNKKVSSAILEDILSNPYISKKDKINKILEYLHSTKQINSDSRASCLQILLKDNFKYIKSLDESVINELKGLGIYIIKLYSIADSFNYCLKINRQERCKSWEDIFKAIGLSNHSSQNKFKDFCEKKNIVRTIVRERYENGKNIKDRYFYFNPNYRKNSVFVCDFVLWLYDDIIRKNNSVDKFVLELLKLKYE